MKTASECDRFGTIEQYGLTRTAELLDDVVATVTAAAQAPDPDAIHKMRVSIRRLQQAVRLFRQFLRKKGVQNVRADLREIMTAAGNVRNYDIAIGLVKKAHGATEQLQVERAAARELFVAMLRSAARPGFDREWRTALGLKR